MGTLSITQPATVESVTSRSDYNGTSVTTPGFTGPTTKDGLSFGPNDQSLINGLLSTFTNGLYFSTTESGLHIVRQITFGFNENGSVFILDGKAPINYNSLPAGFQVTALALSFSAQFNSVFSSCSITAQVNGVNMVNSPFTTVNVNANFSRNIPVPLSATQFIGTRIALALDGIVGVSGGNCFNYGITGWAFTGTYSIVSFTWTLIQPTLPVSVGDHISITSGTLDLSHVSSLNVRYIDNTGTWQVINVNSFVTQTFNLLIFIVPNFTVGYIIFIDAIGDGTQFSGSVTLGQLLTINFTTGSGIYKLVNGKTADTLYLNGTSQTGDVKIPDPFAKLAYIGG